MLGLGSRERSFTQPDVHFQRSRHFSPQLTPSSVSYEQKLAFFKTHVERLALHDAADVAFSYQRVLPLAVGT